MSNNDVSSSDQPQKKKKKKKGFIINPNANLVGSISSDGVLSERLQEQREKPNITSSKLGIPSKSKPKKKQQQNQSKLQVPMTKIEKQRTANGSINSLSQTRIAEKGDEPIQVVEAKRGSKVVTIVRYV